MLLARRQLWCECELKCGCVSATECVIPVSVSVGARVCVRVFMCMPISTQSNRGCSSAGVTESLNLQSCQGQQSQDSELANIQTLFPYIFMKSHLLAADRVFRSVSRVIYRPATAEGLYICGDGAQTAELLRAPQFCLSGTHAFYYTHTNASVQCATPQSSQCYV